MMYGAILGDIIGSPYEFDRGSKTKDFPFFDYGARYTDDSVMTIAVADALMTAINQGCINDEKATKDLIIDSMHKWGIKYPDAGYGGRFYHWLFAESREPYNSWGNGSAMRVSPVGWLFDDLGTTRRIARWTAEVTHNHPEGIKGAESVAAAIFMARKGSAKDEIKKYIIDEFGYDLSRSCDDIRPDYHHVESCQETVPEAITAFLEGENFEDVIRTAVSLGGDCDTLTCIAGSIAEAYYGVPGELKAECEARLPEDMLSILKMRKCNNIKTKEDRPVLAICYDFDKTLSPDNMQAQGYLQAIHYENQDEFWRETNELACENDMDSNLAWMYLMLKGARGKEIFRRDMLAKYGASVELYDGVADWFDRICRYGKEHGVIVEHYIISSGLKEMIEGTCIGSKFTKIYASSFYYDKDGVAIWPAQVVNYTNKTQFLFRISKGVLDVNDDRVNDYFAPDEIRVPFKNIVYIGDSETDIPCMKLVHSYDGHSIGVYNPKTGDVSRVERLLAENRIGCYAPADYTEGSELDKLIKGIIDESHDNI